MFVREENWVVLKEKGWDDFTTTEGREQTCKLCLLIVGGADIQLRVQSETQSEANLIF